MVVVAGASLEDRDEALAELRRPAADRRPARAPARVAGRLRARRARRCGRSSRCAAGRRRSPRPPAGRRLPVPDGDDEVARLARTLNEMLARLEAGLERERRFVAEASHELRTPLALLKTELELALRRPRSRRGAARRDRVGGRGDRPARPARRGPAVLARSDEGELRIDAADGRRPRLLETVARPVRSPGGGRGPGARSRAPAGLVPLDGDRLRLEQALGNLVDNALRLRRRHGAAGGQSPRTAGSTLG